MGSGSFNSASYSDYAKTTRGKTTDQIYSSRQLSPSLNPHGVKLRESRDSADNPNSTPLIVGLDVTGSMGRLADVIARQGLGTLFTGVLERKPISDPHVMFMGIGDAYCDRAPLQVSQFEADNRIVEQLAQLWLEGGGGGNDFESYDLPWYFAAFHTEHDSIDKRGKLGYLFTVGDEEVPRPPNADQLQRIFGDALTSQLSSRDLLEMAQRKYNVYHVIIEEGDYARRALAKVRDTWKAMLGQHVISLSDHTKLAETIVSAIEVAEGRDSMGSAGGLGQYAHGRGGAPRGRALAAGPHGTLGRAAVMRARVVIGANFGDEGKGLVTDYLCATQGAGMVVRFNGGAQAGHTVVTPEGKRHVFSHFGSGTLAGVPTFLSQFFVCNPLLYFKELPLLHAHGLKPVVYAHPSCVVTTFADMVINQRLEARQRHGSVGVGVNETLRRSEIPGLNITMADLWNRAGSLPSKLEQICDTYARFRTGEAVEIEGGIEAFLNTCSAFAEAVGPLGIAQCKDPVFEGAQGLLLDQHNKEYWPHVTPSNTGMKNVRVLCDQAGIAKREIYYVSRTYLTRHGAGPLPGHDPTLRYADDTNQPNAWQGAMRFAPLHVDDLLGRCDRDSGQEDWDLALTHCDQVPSNIRARLYSYGPGRESVSSVSM
jgi:hypothetical protein